MADATITLTAREKYILSAHMLTNILPQGIEEGIKFYDVFKECNLAAYKKMLTSKDAPKHHVDDMNDEMQITESVSPGSVNYLLEILNKQMNGVQALTLVPVAIRLRAVQQNQYK